MDQADTRVAEKLDAFQNEQDPSRLHEALNAILAAERDNQNADDAARKSSLARWLRFFAVLDSASDPRWDPKTAPVMGVPLPSVHGVVHPSGEVDPSSIPDPAERARYEHALQATKDELRRYDVQDQLRRIDEQAMRFARLSFAPVAAGPVSERHDLEQQLSASALSSQRKQRLGTVLAPAGTGKSDR